MIKSMNKLKAIGNYIFNRNNKYEMFDLIINTELKKVFFYFKTDSNETFKDNLTFAEINDIDIIIEEIKKTIFDDQELKNNEELER